MRLLLSVLVLVLVACTLDVTGPCEIRGRVATDTLVLNGDTLIVPDSLFVTFSAERCPK